MSRTPDHYISQSLYLVLKTKIAVALQDEFGRVPTEDELDRVFHLTWIHRRVGP